MFGGNLMDWLTGGSDLGLGGGGMPPGMNPGGGEVPMPPAQGLDVMRSAPQRPGPQFDGTELPPGMYPGGGQIPMPPVQQTGADMPNLADPSTQAMPGGQGAPPMPMAMQADPLYRAGSSPAGGPAKPVTPPMPVAGSPDNAAGPLPPGTPPPSPPTDLSAHMKSYTAAGGGRDVSGTLDPSSGGPQAQGLIARALGLRPETENRLKRGLAAGLTAAGNSSGKSPFQALTSGAGAALDGENKSDDKEYDKKIKYLNAAVSAQSAGDKAAYNKAYAKYLGAKLENEKNAASGGGGRSNAWNKPDSQRFLDAQRAVSQDPDVKASQKVLEGVVRIGSAADVAKAQAAHAKLVADKQNQYVTAVGLDPAKLAANIKNPPGTPPVKGPDGKMSGGNPITVTSQADFDRYVKPGQAYTNPADGKVYIRKGGEKKGESAAAPAAPTSSSPPLPPGLPPIMPGMGATSSDDDE